MFQKVLSPMSDSERRCCFPHASQSQRTRELLFSTNESPIDCCSGVKLFQDSVLQFCRNQIPHNSKAIFLRCSSLVRAASIIFDMFWGNCTVHHDYLEFSTFFTQGKGGSHTIVHEHSPSPLIEWTSSALLICSQILSTCSGWCDPSCLYFHHWELGNQSIHLLEVSALVSILRGVSLCCGWRLQRLHARARGLQDELDELWPLFSCGGESVGIEFLKLCCLGSRSKLKCLTVLGEICGCIGFIQAVLPGQSLLRPSCFIASGASFLIGGQKASYWLRLRRYLLIDHACSTFRHVFVETR